MSIISVIGGGSFGTVIANIIALNGHDVRFWMRSEEMVSEVNTAHENSQYLPGYKLNERVVATENMVTAVGSSEIIFVAVPSSSFRDVVKHVVRHSLEEAIFVSATKGIEVDSFVLMSQILIEEAPKAVVGVLSGPNLAKEIASKNLTGTVIASNHEEVRKRVKEILKSEFFW